MSFIIGDIAGQYDALIRLVAKLPQDADIILVGDLIDRGPKSKEVIEWASTNPRVRAVRGNHEDMFLDFIADGDKYQQGLYFHNGGLETLQSYELPSYPLPEEINGKIPQAHIKWLKSLPLYIEEGIFFISHAPIAAYSTIDEAKAFAETEIGPKRGPDLIGLLWNRGEPANIKGVFQVFGHNANWGLRWFEDDGGKFAICLDDSWQEKLTAFDTETLEVIQEPYYI